MDSARPARPQSAPDLLRHDRLRSRRALPRSAGLRSGAPGHGRRPASAGLRRSAPVRAGGRDRLLHAPPSAPRPCSPRLFVRERTGRGQHVETSLLQGVLALQSGSVVDYPGKPTFLRETPTYRLYQAGDGQWFFLACGNQAFWAKLCKAIGRPEMIDDPRFGSWLLPRRQSRRPHADPRSRLRDPIERRVAHRPERARHSLRARPVAPGVHARSRGPASPDDRAVRASGGRRPDPDGAAPPLLRDAGARRGTSPVLGQHTRAVLREVGYTDGDISDLHRRGVIAGKDL